MRERWNKSSKKLVIVEVGWWVYENLLYCFFLCIFENVMIKNKNLGFFELNFFIILKFVFNFCLIFFLKKCYVF